MPAGSSPFHIGLTPGRIIDTALDLTRERHLTGWSIRDLARRLDVAPSVIYHHVGGKDLLARHVVERVLAAVVVPPATLPWQDWFRTLLIAMYPVVSPYPGVAQWLMMHGPAFPSVVPIMDTGIAVLQAGGFGDRTAVAYAMLLNNAMLTITIGDQRLEHEDDGPRDHATMMAEFAQATAGSPGATLLSEALMTPYAEGGDVADRERAEYYRSVVQVTLDGLAVSLAT
ncbi:MAG TPA: TetR/AcrR family transcriptional regulator [Cellulomonas sp.]